MPLLFDVLSADDRAQYPLVEAMAFITPATAEDLESANNDLNDE